MRPRFEIVRTDAGWHSRFRAGNGQVVWRTESYRRRRTAVAAVDSIASVFYGYLIDQGTAVGCLSSRNSWEKKDRAVAEVRDVDERRPPAPPLTPAERAVVERFEQAADGLEET